MAAHSGQFYTLKMGRQSAKGTPQTTPAVTLKLTGGIVVPEPQVIDLVETDASIQRSRAVKTGVTYAGAIEGYVRSAEFAYLAYGALGANSTAGSSPYTHSATASNSAPYWTLYSAYDSTALVDRYTDCRITELTMRGGAGQALTYSASFLGIGGLHGQTDASGTASTATPLVYPDVTVTLGGATTDIVESFEITSAKVAEVIQGDTGYEPSDVALGRWSVNGTMTILFETDDKWQAWLTGSTSGTNPATTLYTEALTIAAVKSSTDSVTYTLSAVELRRIGLQPDPTGAPLRMTYEFSAQPQSTIANTLTIATVNTTASL